MRGVGVVEPSGSADTVALLQMEVKAKCEGEMRQVFSWTVVSS